MTISEEQKNKLRKLDNYQRAEFLRRRKIHDACDARISELSQKIYELRQETSANDTDSGKAARMFAWLFAVFAISELIFDHIPTVWESAFCILVAGLFLLHRLEMRVERNHNRLRIEMLILESERYEHDKNVNCRPSWVSHSRENQALTMDILRGLGISTGVVGESEMILPLDFENP